MTAGPGGPKDPRRGDSFRGRFVIDTVRGVRRVRKWPRKRNFTQSPQSKKQSDWFAEANRVAKTLDPRQQMEAANATAGTPLLTRDILLNLMAGRAVVIQFEDGRMLRSMAVREDVSRSVDMLEDREGYILIRGPEFWYGIPLPTGGGGGGMTARVTYDALNVSTSNHAMKGMVAEPQVAVTVLAQSWCIRGDAGETYQAFICALDEDDKITEVWASDNEQKPASSDTDARSYWFNFKGAAPLLEPGTRYWFAIARTDASGTSQVEPVSADLNAANGIYDGPFITTPGAYLDKATPEAGDEVSYFSSGSYVNTLFFNPV